MAENILLTGASGFLGKRLAQVSEARSVVNLTAAVRYYVDIPAHRMIEVGCLDGDTDWFDSLAGQQVVIHAAARAHIMKDEVADPLTEYRKVNLKGTLNLARQAASAGVKRFVFISSIKVNGETTAFGKPFTADIVSAPEDPYGISKWEAELGLQKLAIETEMEIVIIRPPLVYGPLVKGNFATVLNLVKKGYPLPLGSITQNKRSLIALDNLVDFILLCADYEKTPQAANQTFVICDGEDVSTAELFQRVAKAYGLKSRLFPFPPSLLRLGAKVLGKQDMADRLLGFLQVDSTKARELLGWKPVVTMDEQLKKMAEADVL